MEILACVAQGGPARYINHCCDPNCYTKTVSVAGQRHIMIYSKRAILEGEELTYDYKVIHPRPAASHAGRLQA